MESNKTQPITIIQKIKAGNYTKTYKTQKEAIESKNQLKNDFLCENPFASEEIFEFAWKWGTKGLSPAHLFDVDTLVEVHECFMDALLIACKSI
jgi:hypothetical protein